MNSTPRHTVSFRALWASASSFAETLALAGVCDRDITQRAAARAFCKIETQWEKFLQTLKRRAKLRYERGELIAAERRAFARECAESRPA